MIKYLAWMTGVSLGSVINVLIVPPTIIVYIYLLLAIIGAIGLWVINKWEVTLTT